MTINSKTRQIGKAIVKAIVVAAALTPPALPLPALAQAPAAAPHSADKAEKSAAAASTLPTTETPERARQARLAADTAKLLQLALELKAEVDKSDKNTMSVAVIKKAAEIEQLARTLKTRMKDEGSQPK